MRILFVNHTFPGDLGPLLSAFAAEPGHEILFASCRGRRDFSVPGVRHVVLSPSRRRLAGDGAGACLDRAVEMGRQALQAFRLLRQSGFVPDMVVLSSALEQGLFLNDAFPEAFSVCFADELPDAGLAGDGRGLVRHLLQCRQMRQCALVVSLTAGRPHPYGERVPHAVALPYPVDTDYFAPAGDGAGRRADGDGLVLCAVRDAADVGRLLRLAEALLERRPDCRPVLLCESAAGRERLAALAASLPSGVEVPERLSLPVYRDALRTAAVITAPDAACLPASVLLEAMSCGVVPVLVGDASHWPLLHDGGGCLWCGAEELVPTLAGALSQPGRLAELSLAARRTVERYFRRQDVIPGHLALLHQARAAWLRKRQGGTTS
ncbi:hypothetical protein [Desulfovibrio piger]|uniref:hypothetical protein n=1 Tax=Desulfovibrio piger TaxID=901 RepID=UPI0039F478E9